MISKAFSQPLSAIPYRRIPFICTKKIIEIRAQLKEIFIKSYDTKIPDLIQFLFSSDINHITLESPKVFEKLAQIRSNLTLDTDHKDFYSYSLPILAYLVILNGHKDLYFDEDGSLNLGKFSDHIQTFFKISNIRIDEANSSVLEGITYARSEGYVVFPELFTLSREEIESCKSLRGIRHAAEALPENLFYNNQHGICAGLSYSHQLLMKNRHFNPAQSREFKLAFLEKLLHAKKPGASVCDILADQFQFQSLTCFEHKRHDENLGHVSDSYLVANLFEATTKIIEQTKKMITTGVKFKSLLIETTDHDLTIDIKVSRYNIKFTLYEPNTEQGAFVTYIKRLDLNNDASDFLIYKLIMSSSYAKSQYAIEGRNPAIGIFCYSFDHSPSEQTTFFDLYHTDISEISNYDVLNSMLFLSAKNGYNDLFQKLLEKDAIDVNYRLLENGHATPLIIAIHNNHIEIVRMLLEHDDLNLNHEMTETYFHATALAVAAKKGRKTIVEMLLKKDSLRLDKIYWKLGGLTAAQLARSEGHHEIEKLINSDSRSPDFTRILRDNGIESSSKKLERKRGVTPNLEDGIPIDGTPLKRIGKMDFEEFVDFDG